MPRLPRSLLLLSPLLATAPAHATPRTWSVDVGGSGDFVNVQQAVDHAAPGDTILIWGPANGRQLFRPVTIDKGLTIIGLAPETVRLDGLRVHDVPAGEAVTLVNLSVGDDFSFPVTPNWNNASPEQSALVEDCAGTVLFRGCSFRGGWVLRGDPGMRVVRADVALLDCDLEGGLGGDAGVSPTGLPNHQHGLVLEDARAFVAGCRLGGGAGWYFETWEDEIGGDGGDGVQALGESTLWLLDSTVLGGAGDEVQGIFGIAIGGDGGAGVRLGPSARGFARASTIRGGLGGIGSTSSGQDGADVVGALAIQAGAALALEAPLWARDVDLVQATVRGEPGTNAFLRVGAAARFRALDGAGVSVADGAISIPLGPLPPSGETTVTIPLPALPDVASQVLLVQSALEEPAGLVLGEARALVVVDERWLPDATQRFHVDAAAAPGGDGRSWASAFSDLHQALEAATGIGPGSTDVWVREGVYRPVPKFQTPIEPFFVKSRTRVYGGFAGTETELSQRDPTLHPTVLSGDLLGDDSAGGRNRDDNSRLVLAVGPWEPRKEVRLDGLTIRSGSNDLIWGNYQTPFRGSGMELHGSVDVVGCTFTENSLSAALFFWGDGELRAVGCRFLGNDSRGDLYSNGACHVGWPNGRGRALFASCEFTANASLLGGAIYSVIETRIVNCTFYGNLAQLEGGAVHTEYDSPELTVLNSLFWGNTAQSGPDIGLGFLHPVPQVDFCLFQGGSTSPWGVGNVEGPPRLVNPAGQDGVLGTIDDDLTPRRSSPAVDAGSNALLPADELDFDADGDVLELLPLDAARRPRRVDDPDVVDTGVGTAPIVDMGSRERQ